MDARNELREIAEIRRAAALMFRHGDFHAELLHALDEFLIHDCVRLAGTVRRTERLDIRRASGHQLGAPHHVAETFLQHRRPAFYAAAQIEPAPGEVRDHVRHNAAVQDNSVYPGVFRQLLPEITYSSEQQLDGIQRIDRFFRSARRMGGFAVENDFQPEIRRRARIRTVLRARMRHHHGIDPFQTAGFHHFDFAAAPFFRRRAEQHDLARDLFLFHHFRRRQKCRDPRRADQVVAAAVADLRQRIVFRGKSKNRTIVRTVFATERRFDPAIRRGDLIALAFHEIADARHCVFFRIGHLGMIPDVI